MGEALFELEQIIRSKPEKMTSQDANILMSFKAKAIRDFTIGAGAGAGITWLATRKLSNILRINLTGGAAAFLGLWMFGRSLESSMEDILSQDGSRMQKELANIMLQKYHGKEGIMQLVTKHFYPEEVYDDSSSDQPKFRWRYRNFFSDNVAQSQRTNDDNTYGEKNETDKTIVKPRFASARSGFDGMVSPLDCVFGIPSQVEEIHGSDSQSTTSRRHSHHHKRSHHRRHRMRHQEVSSST